MIINLKSSRDNFSEYQPDGENYWRLIMGWSGNPVEISQPFYQSHMRRLKNDDWGDTPIHELSHDVDDDKWIFDPETLAFIKLAYVLEKLGGEVYRIDTEKYYTGSTYANFLKTDWFEGYNESFVKGIYMPAGLASILLDIKKNTGWDAFSKTFKYMGELSWRQVPDTELGKLNLFLTCLGNYSGKNVFNMISSRDKNILAENFGGTIEKYTPPVADIPGGSTGRRVDISVQKGDYKQYQFVPTKTGNYRIYTAPYGDSGAVNDTYVEIYTENTETGTPIASNDDYGTSKFSRIDINLSAGQPYYIKVYNYNRNNSRLHARLHIMSNDNIADIKLDSPQNVITENTEFKTFKFTPGSTGVYTFSVDGYNGGELSYDTYIKLYDNDSFNNMIGQNETKVVARLNKGHTYYLQFSGFLMRYAKARVTVRQGQTVQFTKKPDANFIYVNSPEYITRIDMVDDACHTRPLNENIGIQPCLKIFEQENVTGKNTYYQTHVAWWGGDVDYEPSASFYTDIDFYNPTNSTITVSISNLAYGNEYSILENYYNGGGTNINISIPAHEHRLLFETLNAPLMMSYPGPPAGENGWDWSRHRSPMILFDFQVNNGNTTVSSLAAYNRNNLCLRNGYKNIIDSTGKTLDSGEIIYRLSDRPNEDDLYGKYKGIAKNQSAWIDVSLEFSLDDSLSSGQPLQVNLKDEKYPNGVANPKTWWMTHINPLNDQWDGLLFAMPGSEHRFTYHRDIGGVWNFAYDYHDVNDISIDAKGNASINNPVPNYILQNAALDVSKGQKEHFSGTPDELACGMGAWGATYHYTITIANQSDSEKSISYQVKNVENMIFGYKTLEDQNYTTQYIPSVGSGDSDWRSFQSIAIPANEMAAFEIVTMLGGGHGGTNNRIVLN